ncbi:uncharacterized protein [Pocillopora verrucosa]|uniref:uncharacterized protein n=1 Tax=Pocillopora verrucosa TaxID=203993 RepID=UPI0033424A96
MDVKHTFLIALTIVLLCEKAQSRKTRLERTIASYYRRAKTCSGGNLIKIYTDMCQIVNGKKQCKVYCNGRTDLDQNTRFDIVKWNGKKCIQKRVGLITYSLKVINETNVVFEDQSACNASTSNEFLFKEEKDILTNTFTYKYISSTNQAMYLGVNHNCTDKNLYVYSTNVKDRRCYMNREKIKKL